MSRAASVSQRIVARVMRDARTRAGKTAADASARAGFAQGTLSKYERSENPFPVSVVYQLADYYGMSPDDRDKLCDLAGQKSRGWWHVYREIPSWFATYIAFEFEATVLKNFEDSVVPGLLQTTDYARALLAADVNSGTSEQVEAQVRVREQRQSRLTGDDTVKLAVVFSEAALYRPAGGPQIMREQLDHLVQRADLANVDLRVLPFAAGVHTATETNFMIMGFPDLLPNVDFGDVAYLEYKLGSLYLEEEDETAVFTRVFQRLQDVSLSPTESVKLIEKVRDEHYS